MTSHAVHELPELCFTPPLETARWVQFDIGLVRRAGDARLSAQEMFKRVVDWWEPRAGADQVHGWFFMRKPPDVRLRILATAVAQPALSSLAQSLQQAVADGVIASSTAGTYHPEVARFGGAAALNLVHAWFMLDSVLWYRFEQIDRQAQRALSAGAALAAVFHDLFREVAGDVVAPWHSLARHVLLDAEDHVDAGAPASLDDLCRAAELGAEERAILAAYRAGNRFFARALREVSPICSTADIAATTAFFTFNRHGFPAQRSAPIVAGVVAGLHR
ncbi:MAG: hypothetical protein EXR86_01335 [Gammaproteobacteria bacterium]|nr:hypothetical protein [Gammaproteobacteria bacterium]